MRPTEGMRALCPDCDFGGEDLIFADWMEERGYLDNAWCLRHSGKVSRSAVKGICEAVGYTGRKIILRVVDAGDVVELGCNYWDGGTRSIWYRCLAHNGVHAGGAYRYSDGHPAFNRPVDNPKADEGALIVRHDFYCGKDCGLTIYGTPATLRRLLESRKPARV